MTITGITVWALDLPLAEPYWLSGGRLRFDRLDSTFVRVDTAADVSGWGESCPWGHTYLPAHGPGVRAGIETLAPALIGQDACALDHINRVMDETLPGHPYVKSALDLACWDILGKTTGMPLWRLMGSAEPVPVAINSSIATGTPEEMIARIERAAAQGYRVHSAKIGGTDIAADIARIEAIEQARPAGHEITFDINRAWTPAVAIEVLNSVQARGWIEQPCQTLEQCARVAERVPQPIMLDECLHDFGNHLSAWRLGVGEGTKLKANRVGGLTKARRIRDLGIELGWRMHIEDCGGTALADTASIHLAASTPDPYRLASWLCHAHLAVDPVPGQGARNIEGYATPPDLPGIGVEPEAKGLGEPVSSYGHVQ